MFFSRHAVWGDHPSVYSSDHRDDPWLGRFKWKPCVWFAYFTYLCDWPQYPPHCGNHVQRGRTPSFETARKMVWCFK